MTTALGNSLPNHILMYSQVFKMDMVVMSIAILCVVSAVLYQGIALLEKKIKT